MKKNIMGKDVEYVFIDLGEEADGYFSPEDSIIMIDENIKGDYKKQVILHEEFHVVLDQIGFNETSINENVEEMIVETLSRFVIDNYHLNERK